MDSIRLLISDYLDGELDEHDLERLAELLRANPEAAGDLALSSFIHSQLMEWMNERGVQDKALRRPLRAGGVESELVRSSNEGVRRSKARRVSEVGGPSRRWFFAAIAATVLVTATAGVLSYLAITRPTYVAQLTQTRGARWQGSQANLAVGTLLERGQQLHLVDGYALITFVSGAQVVVKGPTTLRLESDMALDMDDGRVTAHVPTHAIGFTITGPRARIIDLGTEFTLALEPGGDFEIHVFEGMVEIQLDDGSQEKGQELRVAESQGRAVRFVDGSAKPENIPYDAAQRMSL